MKTLYQILLESTPNNDSETARLSSLNGAQIIKIDNVAETYFESEQIFWDLTSDFPNIAPPFETMYFEYKQPEKFVAEEGTINLPDNARKTFGVLCRSEKTNDGEHGWAYAITYFVGDGVNAKHINICGLCEVTENGLFHSQNKEGGMTYALSDKEKESPFMGATIALIEQINHVVFLAISFMHCKNVAIISRGTGTNKGKRNRHTPGIRHYTLQIDPMRRILETEGESKKLGLKHALHICRGHFKDYRKTGLFGKYHDIYWWDSMVRGSKKEGIVLKDYKINSPFQGRNYKSPEANE